MKVVNLRGHIGREVINLLTSSLCSLDIRHPWWNLMNTAQEIGLPGPQAHRKDEAGSREVDTGIMMKRQSLGAREQNYSSVITMAVDPLIKK